MRAMGPTRLIRPFEMREPPEFALPIAEETV